MPTTGVQLKLQQDVLRPLLLKVLCTSSTRPTTDTLPIITYPLRRTLPPHRTVDGTTTNTNTCIAAATSTTASAHTFPTTTTPYSNTLNNNIPITDGNGLAPSLVFTNGRLPANHNRRPAQRPTGTTSQLDAANTQ